VNGLFDQIQEAHTAIRRHWQGVPKAGLILGTGLGDLASRIEAEATIPYAEIPHFAVSTAPSHAGRLICGRLAGVPLVSMEGRIHYYEGYSMGQITFPVRIMRALGAEVLLVTNACGAMNPEYKLANVVLIDDHVNLMPENPLRGVNDDRLGPRFPDLSAPYDRELLAIAEKAALELSVPLQKGILAAVAGPNLETRTEYRMLRQLGADVVSMSTVPEVIVAVHAGLRVLGLAIVTDRCIPEELEPVRIETILQNAAEGGKHLERLIPRILERL
jgi:purine-nucleoside phosphorylase